jgi:alpha-tubulin suppressor-like RCC1 family protein
VLATGIGCLGLGFEHSCVGINGSAWCWGDNTDGQLGNNSTTSRASAVPVQGFSSDVQAIVGANSNSYALVNGGVQAWGDNSQGELGNDATTNSLAPVPVQGLSSGVQTVVAGWFHACALASGEVWCWGANNYGQLGNTGSGSDVPVLVQGLPSGVQAIAAGDYHTCVLVADNVWCWGLNADAQLGYAPPDYGGLNPFNPNPVRVAGVPSGMRTIAAGASLSCVLADGKVWCWGKTDDLSGPAANAVPAMVSGLPSFVRAVAVGGHHACALLDDGIMCWGRDDAGQLGDNSPTTIFSSLPVRVQGLPSPAQAVAAGWYHTCAWAASAVWCWGANFSGELGNNSTSLSGIPVRVLGLPGS